MRYLDPRNDLVFKRIFGEHPEILRSFLNAVLPLPLDGKIERLEYLSAEQAPQIPLLKNTIVDVRCRDQKGRQFIVEMQMNWTSAFLQRVLFNASKAYVRQLERGEQYELLQPVIGLSLLDDVFDQKSPAFYHHYQLVNVQQTDRVIDGLQLVFVELPKFSPELAKDPRLIAWLRFFREAGETETEEQKGRLQEQVMLVPEIGAALEIANEAAFSRAELEAYDRHWDAVRSEKTLIEGKYREGKEEGREEGRAEAMSEALRRLVSTGMEESEAKRVLGM